MADESPRGRVLVADDDEAMRRFLLRTITSDGYSVHTVSNGDEAVSAFASQSFDLVLSDIDMPGRNGIELLIAIRERDLDVPVLLLTGGPSLDTAIAAVEYGANSYLRKPVDLLRLRDAMRRAMQAGALARARRNLADLVAGEGALQIGDLAGLSTRFARALETAFMMFQPIVRWSDQSVVVYEALIRSAEPTLPRPGALFDAGDRLGRVIDIGRRVRSICGATIMEGDDLLFVNLHARDLADDALYESDAPLSKIASRVVLEITERARLEVVSEVPARIARLRDLGFRVAIDDIGAGYAGLTSFAVLEPHFVKLDRALVQDLDTSTMKQRLVGAMIRACLDLGVQVVGEGVETAAERDALIALECDLLQGFLFARPERPFVQPVF